MRALFAAMLFTGAGGCLFAQSADSSPRFDEATIAPAESRLADGLRAESCPASSAWWESGALGPEGCMGGPETPEPGFLQCEVSLATFIALAYHVGPLQFTPPEWMESS